MAVTKILYRNGGLRQAIDYITNPVKTDENLLTDYVRCDPGHAAQQMMDTKRALGKTAGRQCYHIIQSFKHVFLHTCIIFVCWLHRHEKL